MGSSSTCRECGATIPADSPGRFCAQCLFRLGLEKGEEPSETSPKPKEQARNSPKPPVKAANPSSERVVVSPTTEKPGDRIGRYRLLEEIGHGGCGVVYMAEQEEPVRRKVALKVIKLGMDTRQVVARFEAERQALALMDHTNIAKVLDAGATETGRPYFVMELVGGIKITDYCEQNHLRTRQRLDLFIQVCHAIQHAHQKGVIHRDIKPSNVLVATQDGVPVPKVIDFGIAKATQGKLSDQTVFTAFEQFLGTPAYMSPEQAQVGGLDVDTRSDIYSLGVLLYELLTGRTPFDAKELLAAGLEAMRRTIQEQEPPTPSARLKLDVEQVQGSGESKIKNQKSKIANDLDWIVMKCLEKDRARRYETANGLAVDLQRHLNQEPVLAGPPKRLYRFQKLVRRNKLAFVAATTLLAALVAGAAVSTWQAIRATRAEREQGRLRQQAQTEAAKSEQVAQFLKDMLAGVGPSKAQGRDTTMLREILDNTAARVGIELTNQPEVEIELLHTLALTYGELGLYNQVVDTAQEALRLARAHLGKQHAVTARVLEQLAAAQDELGNYDQAESNHREVLAMRRKLFGNDHTEVAGALNSLALVVYSRGKLPEAEAMFREALAIGRKALGNEHPYVASALSNLGMVLRHERKLAEAEAVRREALAMDRKLLGNEHPNVAGSLNDLATVLADQGKQAEAEAMFRESLALRRKLLGNEHPSVPTTLNNLASVLSHQGKLTEAEAMYQEALATLRKRLGEQSPRVAVVLNGLGFVFEQAGNLPTAEATYREALAINRKKLGDEHTDVAATLDNLGQVLRKQGKLGEAETLARDRLQGLRDRVPVEHPEFATAVDQLAVALVAEEKFAEAESLARESLAIREKLSTDDWLTFNTRNLLGVSLLGLKKYGDAEPLLLTGYVGMKQREATIANRGKERLKEAIQNVVQLYEVTGQTNQAAQWKRQLEDFERSQTNRTARPSTSKP